MLPVKNAVNRYKALIRLCLGAVLMLCQAMPAAADVAEDMARGEEAYNRQDVVDAMRWFQSAAEQGYARIAGYLE